MSFRGLLAAAVVISVQLTGVLLQKDSKQLSRFLKSLAAQGYDRSIRPDHDKATKISIQIGLLAFGPVDLQTMSMRSDILLRLWWHDKRLAFDNDTVLTLSDNPDPLFWIPDVYIFNALKTKSHTALKKNFRVKVGPGGDVYVSCRLTIDFSCEMNFKLFPMDTQICSMNLESFSYTSNEVILEWIKIAESIEFTRNFKVSGYTMTVVDNVTEQLDYGVASRFNILKAVFSLRRQFHFYLYHTYIPSAMVVFLAFAAFWIPVSAIPARVTLIVTSFLTSMVLFTDAGNSIPQVPYHTALEVFTLINMIFIFMVMVEYVLILSNLQINLKPRKDGKRQDFLSFSRHPLQNHHTNKGFEKSEHDVKDISTEGSKTVVENFEHMLHEKAHDFDRYSRILFPSSYLIFLVVYFIHYLIIAN